MRERPYSRPFGERILSAFTLANHLRIWVITEADRSSTLLPHEY